MRRNYLYNSKTDCVRVPLYEVLVFDMNGMFRVAKFKGYTVQSIEFYSQCHIVTDIDGHAFRYPTDRYEVMMFDKSYTRIDTFDYITDRIFEN